MFNNVSVVQQFPFSADVKSRPAHGRRKFGCNPYLILAETLFAERDSYPMVQLWVRKMAADLVTLFPHLLISQTIPCSRRYNDYPDAH